jgi:hypothetical protein
MRASPPFVAMQHESEPTRFGNPLRLNQTGKCPRYRRIRPRDGPLGLKKISRDCIASMPNIEAPMVMFAPLSANAQAIFGRAKFLRQLDSQGFRCRRIARKP